MIKILTCQTWVTMQAWFTYARHHPEQVPFLLVDRSPCTDPFLDPYASPQDRRPIISGLCRVKLIKKDLKQGNTFIYITRVARQVCRDLKIPTTDERHTYLGIAALKIVKEHPSHECAAKTFTSRRYIVAPDPTPYPPNLVHDLDDLRTCVAVRRESCIVSYVVPQKRGEKIVKKTVHCTPDQLNDNHEWGKQVGRYHIRQKKNQLPVAECCLEAIQLDPAHAPVFTPADWGGEQMNLPGIELDAEKADWFRQRIARGR
jgi:hypothetical protein